VPVVASEFSVGHAQRDGRRYITERHVLDTGEVVVREYGPVVEIDYAAVAQVKAAQIDASIAEREADEAQAADAAAAREKVAAVLADAQKTGAITREELALAGHEMKAAEVVRG